MDDKYYMGRCLQLAALGSGKVAPNPMVGAVLVYKDRVIGEGYHQLYGEAHAEVNCINSVSPEDKGLISESVLYVSLEPCSHFGKTPPCADLIIKYRIWKVVIGCRDIFSEVNGRGIEKLKAAGILVVEGILAKEAIDLNKRFFCFHQNGRPYIFLKWAQTADSFIGGPHFENTPISNELTNRWVHRMRSAEAAIMVGTHTALYDNPSLTTRLWKGNNPIRIILDKNLMIPRSAAVFKENSEVLILNCLKQGREAHVHFIQTGNGPLDLPQIMQLFFNYNIQSLIVEGGRKLLQSFIDAGLWDEAVIITNHGLLLENGTPAPILSHGASTECFRFRGDLIQVFKNSPS